MKKISNSIIITSIIVGAFLIICLVAIIKFAPMSSSNKITVEGVAQVTAQPDLIGVYFNVETQGETYSEAKDLNNEIYDFLVSKLLIQGFEKTELKTQSFNIYPNYEWDGKKQTQNGYKAMHSLKLELSSEEFDKVGGVIDAGVDSGAGINYINFELSQELQNQYKAEALKFASEDARIKAEAVAEGLNKRVGKLISVSVSEFGYYPWGIYLRDEGENFGAAEAQVAKDSVTEIQPDDKEINARVSAVFKIV